MLRASVDRFNTRLTPSVSQHYAEFLEEHSVHLVLQSTYATYVILVSVYGWQLSLVV